MKDGLTPGVEHRLHFLVTADMAPQFHADEIVHPVLSTWSLVHQMELAGRLLLEPFLEADEEGVGGGIEIKHAAPALIGTRVAVAAVVESLERGRLWTTVEAHAGPRLLAHGRFLQVIMPRDLLQRTFRKCLDEVDDVTLIPDPFRANLCDPDK